MESVSSRVDSRATAVRQPSSVDWVDCETVERATITGLDGNKMGLARESRWVAVVQARGGRYWRGSCEESGILLQSKHIVSR